MIRSAMWGAFYWYVYDCAWVSGHWKRRANVNGKLLELQWGGGGGQRVNLLQKCLELESWLLFCLCSGQRFKLFMKNLQKTTLISDSQHRFDSKKPFHCQQMSSLPCQHSRTCSRIYLIFALFKALSRPRIRFSKFKNFSTYSRSVQTLQMPNS